MTDKIKIISNAISYLGKGPITTIASGGEFASTAENMYDMTISSVLSKDNWRFATAIIQLSQLVETPIIDDWDYIYQLPSNYLSLVRLYPDTRDFQIYENKHLYSNNNELHIEYRFKPDESRFPSYFEEFYTYYLAVRIALSSAITGDTVTRLEAMAEKAYASGLAADGKSHPNTSISSKPYTQVRGA